jgi:Fe-S-cluster containining protein
MASNLAAYLCYCNRHSDLVTVIAPLDTDVLRVACVQCGGCCKDDISIIYILELDQPLGGRRLSERDLPRYFYSDGLLPNYYGDNIIDMEGAPCKCPAILAEFLSCGPN